MRWIGGTLIFLAEIAMGWALAWLGLALLHEQLGWPVVPAFGAAIVVPFAVALLWGTFLSPKARRPLPPGATLAARTLLLLSGAIAFLAVGSAALAIAQVAAIIVGTALMAIWPIDIPGPTPTPATPAEP
jgi:hypothetical protein